MIHVNKQLVCVWLHNGKCAKLKINLS